MEDFEKFYGLLRVHHPYITGESFYAEKGRDTIRELSASGKAVFFTQELAQKEKSQLDRALQEGCITEKEYERIIGEILSDIGSYVIPLGNFERYVVLKGDESTIYATRDMAAIKHRMDMFDPKLMVYEVGQEQSEHFDKLFRSAKKTGFVPDDQSVDLKHIFHGFYVAE